MDTILLNMIFFIGKPYSYIWTNATTLRKKAIIYQGTTMLATSKNVLFPGHNHLLTTGADDPSLTGAWAITEVSGYQHRFS